MPSRQLTPSPSPSLAERARTLLKQSVSEQGQPPAETRQIVERAEQLARLVAEVGLDEEAVAAACLLPAPRLDLAVVAEAVGQPVADLLLGVRRVASLQWQNLESEQAEALRKAFLALAEDLRSAILALAQRLVQLRQRAATPTQDADSLRRFAQETLDVHAALANRLGIWQLKWPLEDTAFRILEPETYAELKRLIAAKRGAREAFVESIVEQLQTRLAAEGIEGSVSGRPKHIYSVVRKMRRKQVSFEEVFDLIAVRVLVEKVSDCYALLGLVHSLWVPIPHEMDDYIAMPKPNGYQSLHTAVIGPSGRAVEVQIRTTQMHRFAEYGVAAHWAYKEGRSGKDLGERFTLVRQLLELSQGAHHREKPAGADPDSFADSLRNILFNDQVFVFTPKGKIVELADGATPLDFAYRIHTEVGHRCKGARVNGQIAPLTSRLKTGDRVEILTHKLPSPSRDWMNSSQGFLTSARARSHVRSWFRAQEEEAAPGMKQAPPPVPTSNPTGDSREAAQAIVSPPAPNAAPEPARGIVLDDVDDILGRRAQCCAPLPGDEVVGFITRGRGLTLHRRDCAQVSANSEPERLVDVVWGGDNRNAHRVQLHLVLEDATQAFPNLVSYLSKVGEHLVSATQLRSADHRQRWNLQLQVRDSAHEQALVNRLGTLRSVVSVRPVRGA